MFPDELRESEEHYKERLEKLKAFREEGISLQQGQAEVYQFLSEQAYLEEDPFDHISIFFRAAQEAGYGVRVLERRMENIQADVEAEEIWRSEGSGPKYLVMVDSPGTESQLKKIMEVFRGHIGWKLVKIADNVWWWDSKFVETVRRPDLYAPEIDENLIRRGFVRGLMRKTDYISPESRSLFPWMDEAGRLFDYLIGELGVEPITERELIDLDKKLILEAAAGDPTLRPLKKNS